MAATDKSAASVLAAGAAAAGLSAELAPWPREGTMAERLAAGPFLMAPMAGVTDKAYRLMARAGGASLAYSEMVSVAGIHYGGEKTWELVEPDPAEPDIAVQLFGSKPEQFEEAAAAVQERLGDKLALIDINMACPVPKVTKKGEGSALLDDPERAAAIVRACTGHCEVPVTVKMRIGRTAERPVGPDFARAMEQAGVSALACHGRFASQLYRGTSDDAAVAAVVGAVSVPVVASGDALTAARAVELKDETRAAAAFVARGTYGDPWVFGQAEAIEAGRIPEPVTLFERLAAFRLHVRLLEATNAHIARARSLAGWYLRGVPHAANWRERAMHCKTADDYCRLAESVENEVRSAVDAGKLTPTGVYLRP